MHAINEDNIRPDDLMERVKVYVDWDRNYLLEQPNRFVHTDCPACNSKKHTRYFKKLGITYNICQNCETVFVNPRPGPELLRDFYAQSRNYDFWNKHIFPATEEVRRERIFKPRVARTIACADRFLSEYGSIIEIGAGFGIFCEELKKTGRFKKVLALEPTPGLAETCRRRNLETLEVSIEDIPEVVKVDIVAGFEVLEHLFSPRDTLLRCFSIISPGGLLILTCPNVKGFDIAVLQAASNSIDHEHLNYFHPDSLAYLVSECGFEVLEVLTPGELDAELVRKGIIANKLDVSSYPFLKYMLIDKWKQVGGNLQRFLADNLLSSHMWLVARKVD